EVKLSTGLDCAIRAELARRGQPAPPAPPAQPWRCRGCFATGFRATWVIHRNGHRQIRGECVRCGWGTYLAQTPDNCALADAGSHPTPLLTFLVALEEAGISVRLADGQLRFTPPLPRHLWDLERQCRGQLHQMLIPESVAHP